MDRERGRRETGRQHGRDLGFLAAHEVGGTEDVRGDQKQDREAAYADVVRAQEQPHRRRGQDRRQQYQQLVVRTFYLSNTDPDAATTLITRALPASVGRPQAIVVPDKYTNSLTVRDTAENIALIGELLRSIDKDRAEVVMDVDIYEVSRNDLMQSVIK